MKFSRVLILVLVIVIVDTVSAEALSWPWEWFKGKEKDNRPLYVDDSGWEIRSALPGTRIVEKYERVKSMGLLSRIPDSRIPEHQKYISFSGADNFYGFSLIIPSSIVTYWNKSCAVILEYTCDGDTLQARSYEYFFAVRSPNKLIFGLDLENYFYIPNPSLDLWKTSKGNPILFAGFDFKGNEPERLLKCLPVNVRSNSKELP
ncbi:MAG: hypothetical protein U5O15_10735 [Candidatus Krumholzibacteriota bacterium]|nr:hypothetical protein [Candidatus Krumholzibacteriota bacterium]